MTLEYDDKGLLKILENAETSEELLIHLKDQLRANRTKRFGNGPVQKNINFIRQKLTDDFHMTEEEILEAVKK